VKIAVKHAAAQMAIPHNEVDQLSTSEVEVDVVPEGDAAAMADVVKVAAGEVVTSGLGAEVGDPGRPQWASVDRGLQCGGGALDAAEDPGEDAGVFPEPGPERNPSSPCFDRGGGRPG
jgi:hypothetical protein